MQHVQHSSAATSSALGRNRQKRRSRPALFELCTVNTVWDVVLDDIVATIAADLSSLTAGWHSLTASGKP
ncbi:hypothetical protein RGR602_PB00380 (plasmid) [Rhizobium gallicum bv. gallicum R602sp]|uniref:Uncharacterized protein n=1 Tax=Rhizobium gallicum bv. gallicum R602sp TaxID=1041138 RepID=A0A0B4X9W8_9HYPH|nr:hypothetical protein RGR602_PB00380 [Rhizobium gallicum bv. gallicum R602sp]